MKLRALAGSCLLLALPGCATSHLLQVDLDLVDPSCEYSEPAVVAPEVCVVAALLAVGLAFDIVTFPYQYARGYYPYGDRCR